jgi:hypothetical protein
VVKKRQMPKLVEALRDYNLRKKEISKLLKLSWATISVWFITFALTIFADLTLPSNLELSWRL